MVGAGAGAGTGTELAAGDLADLWEAVKGDI